VGYAQNVCEFPGGGAFSGLWGGEFIFIAQHKKEPKSLSPDTISGLKMYPKRFCGWGCAPNPAGGAHSTPQDHVAGFRGPLRDKKEGNGNRRRGREGGEGKVERRMER